MTMPDSTRSDSAVNGHRCSFFDPADAPPSPLQNYSEWHFQRDRSALIRGASFSISWLRDGTRFATVSPARVYRLPKYGLLRPFQSLLLVLVHSILWYHGFA